MNHAGRDNLSPLRLAIDRAHAAHNAFVVEPTLEHGRELAAALEELRGIVPPNKRRSLKRVADTNNIRKRREGRAA